MVESEDITVDKKKTQEISLEINTSSDTLQTKDSIVENTPQSPQIHAVGSINKSKPQSKILFILSQKNHFVSTCNCRPYMLAESKPQSKSHKPSFYQHF